MKYEEYVFLRNLVDSLDEAALMTLLVLIYGQLLAERSEDHARFTLRMVPVAWALADGRM